MMKLRGAGLKRSNDVKAKNEHRQGENDGVANPHPLECLVQPVLYPRPICMMCGQECVTVEHVETAPYSSEFEMWCYCRECHCETFHELPPEYR